MSEDQKDISTDRKLPPRNQVHGRKRKRKKVSPSVATYDRTEEEHVQKNESNHHEQEENLLASPADDHAQDESHSYPLYRRPERKKNDYFLVKIWLVLFLLIVIGMVTYPIWQEWL
ncbi:hypothetical protein [Salisediminibacterium selenitireducens]|uniref:Uncharacterized protein n=1 Tax=Bacillus selenitireducens (strain ATCC 700615 / DSM 15326 / MLS10) TaxID=439292 RepID=D6XVC8_BACIE|nr:hypothetical protein [Salisediminibacterium selenitireducens]ADH99666.1 hypothetical protein Bsel_2162 [[Bacillus] selenitireducens MLS10]